VQLFSFKTPDGRSPAFSDVVGLAAGLAAAGPVDYVPPFSVASAMNTTGKFLSPRHVPNRSHAEAYARQASLDDLLGSITQAAAPLLARLLGGSGRVGKVTIPGGPPPAAQPTGGGDTAALLATLLKAVLDNIPGAASLSLGASRSPAGSSIHVNRFADGNAELSRPFIFGIDDALIGALAGPLLQALPQLLNAANQQRLQAKQADNKLIADILSDVNRRMLLTQLLQAQAQAPAAGAGGVSPADLARLQQLLQQQSLPSRAPAVARSLDVVAAPDPTLSPRAVLTFVTAPAVSWNGAPTRVFTRDKGMLLKVRLDVAPPAPKSPLPKAIFTFTFKDPAGAAVLFEKTFKQKGVAAGSVLTFPLAPEELGRLPLNRPLAVFAQMRWLRPGGSESRALGSLDLVLVGTSFVKEPGKPVAPEHELTDMNVYRPFWNKVWEAPNLDAARPDDGGRRKSLWELDVTAKYTVILSVDHPANGLMATKLLRAKADPDSLREKVEGRMKAGIELSLDELNRLASLWDREGPLPAEKLEAFRSPAVAKAFGGELVTPLKLGGRSGERGMVWVIPVFRLFEFTLQSVRKTDECGQVVDVAEEKARLPLPVSARVLALKSTN
jgi:hypothetical protein